MSKQPPLGRIWAKAGQSCTVGCGDSENRGPRRPRSYIFWRPSEVKRAVKRGVVKIGPFLTAHFEDPSVVSLGLPGGAPPQAHTRGRSKSVQTCSALGQIWPIQGYFRSAEIGRMRPNAVQTRPKLSLAWFELPRSRTEFDQAWGDFERQEQNWVDIGRTSWPDPG